MEWMKQNSIDALSGEKLGVALRRFTGLELTVEEVKMAQGIKAGWQEIVKGRTGIGWTGGHHTGGVGGVLRVWAWERVVHGICAKF
jgi:hypothetical protein